MIFKEFGEAAKEAATDELRNVFPTWWKQKGDCGVAQRKMSTYRVIIMFPSRILVYEKLGDVGRQSECGTIHEPVHFSKNAKNFLPL